MEPRHPGIYVVAHTDGEKQLRRIRRNISYFLLSRRRKYTLDNRLCGKKKTEGDEARQTSIKEYIDDGCVCVCVTHLETGQSGGACGMVLIRRVRHFYVCL